jgi:hypothetical protein
MTAAMIRKSETRWSARPIFCGRRPLARTMAGEKFAAKANTAKTGAEKQAIAATSTAFVRYHAHRVPGQCHVA